MKHPEIEQLERYARRQSNADELTLTVLHLDDCSKCFAAFQRMFPDLSDAAREISIDHLTADDAEDFHLNYEDHLRPYIDFAADGTVREIVESHIRNCSFCDRAVRELREFSDGLKLRGLEKDDPADRSTAGESVFPPHRFSSGNLRHLVLSAVAVSILGIGGWMIWRHSENTTPVAEKAHPPAAPEISINENSLNRLPHDPLSRGETVLNKSPIPPRRDNLRGKKPEKIGGKIPESNPPEELRLFTALPADFRVQFQNALLTQRIKLPSFIAGLREKVNPRGEPGNKKSAILTPNAQAERSDRPTFRWRKIAGRGENYIVTIYDENFNRLAVSPNLRTAEWQSNIVLERGRTYRWQLETNQPAATYTAQFRVLDAEAIVRLKAVEKAVPHSFLARGIGYASEGLLNEAEREFQKEMLKDPRRNLAKKLRDSLSQELNR